MKLTCQLGEGFKETTARLYMRGPFATVLLWENQKGSRFRPMIPGKDFVYEFDLDTPVKEIDAIDFDVDTWEYRNNEFNIQKCTFLDQNAQGEDRERTLCSDGSKGRWLDLNVESC